jgi:hypothetical protein
MPAKFTYIAIKINIAILPPILNTRVSGISGFFSNNISTR